MVEQAVGVLLGADPEVARTAVGVLEAGDLLGDGLAVHALLVASRKGTDPASAIGLIAERGLTAGDSSDYERRAAVAEAQEEAQAALRDAHRCALALALVRTALATDSGAAAEDDTETPAASVVAEAWRGALERACAAPAQGPPVAVETSVHAAGGSPPIRCSEAFLDLLAAAG